MLSRSRSGWPTVQNRRSHTYPPLGFLKDRPDGLYVIYIRGGLPKNRRILYLVFKFRTQYYIIFFLTSQEAKHILDRDTKIIIKYFHKEGK